MTNAPTLERPLFKFAVIIPAPNDSVIARIKIARRFALEAEIEFERGREAQTLADKQQNQNFTRIAAWHFGRCAEKARQAKMNFLSAHKSQTSQIRREYCRLKAVQIAALGSRARKLNRF